MGMPFGVFEGPTLYCKFCVFMTRTMPALGASECTYYHPISYDKVVYHIKIVHTA